jgi:predicted transcriptional regulator
MRFKIKGDIQVSRHPGISVKKMGEIFILECDTEKEAHRICSENN